MPYLPAGRCVCKLGFCYADGACVLDTNECTAAGADVCMADDQVCINTPCRPEPECVGMWWLVI